MKKIITYKFKHSKLGIVLVLGVVEACLITKPRGSVSGWELWYQDKKWATDNNLLRIKKTALEMFGIK